MSEAPKHPGLDGRARDKDGQIDHKHPTTKIKHLREHYGKNFAPGWDGERTLGELLKESNFESLTHSTSSITDINLWPKPRRVTLPFFVHSLALLPHHR